MRSLAVVYGVIAYAIFFATFLYAIGFVGGVVVPKGIDSGAVGPLANTLLIDTLLLGVFAIQHSVMARPAFKTWWTKFVPPPIERSTYVLFASLALILLFWQWRPLPTPVWSVQSPTAAMAIWALFGIGWATVLLSTFLINHFDLFGLRQVWAYRRNREIPPSEFHTPLFYRVVRHPLYLGFIIAFWAAPTMSRGRLFFALATTAYILIAIQLEEHDLINHFGDTYRDYKNRVGMLIPLPFGRRAKPVEPSGPVPKAH
jgi:protein-S-isoprenylcysteine O-methyltransferase Ste14